MIRLAHDKQTGRYMARGINKTISIGNLCADPECRHMPSGDAVTNIRIAINNSYKDKKTGDTVDTVEYIPVVFFNRLAEIAGEYLRKGSKVYIEGSLRTRKWEDKDGNDRYTTEIVAREMQMLDSRQDAQQGEHQKQSSARPPPPQNQPMGVHQKGQAPQQEARGFDDFEDDPPF